MGRGRSLRTAAASSEAAAWQRFWSEQHQRYYFYDTLSRTSQWENPFADDSDQEQREDSRRASEQATHSRRRAATLDDSSGADTPCHLGPDPLESEALAIEVTSRGDPELVNSSTGCTLRSATVLASSVSHLNQVRIYLPAGGGKIDLRSELPAVSRHVDVIKSNKTFQLLPDEQVGCEDISSKPGYPHQVCFGGQCDSQEVHGCRCPLTGCRGAPRRGRARGR